MGRKKPKHGCCSFCGCQGEVTREHVVPIGLFPPSTRNSARFVLIPSCDVCNGGFAKFEDDFRNFCTLAGEDTAEAKELFYGPVRRAMNRENHGECVLKRLISKMTEHESLPGRHVITPDNDVKFILRKIIRGLTFEHFKKIVSDDCVDVIVLIYEIPEGLDPGEQYRTIHPDVCQYFYQEVDEDRHSVWILKILHTRIFIGYVSNLPIIQRMTLPSPAPPDML